MTVALRKESVDRNRALPRLWQNNGSLSARRAWIEMEMGVPIPALPQSLSARRAWIEIAVIACSRAVCSVALRKESVDRNISLIYQQAEVCLSLSARRAWIEISGRPCDVLRI